MRAVEDIHQTSERRRGRNCSYPASVERCVMRCSQWTRDMITTTLHPVSSDCLCLFIVAVLPQQYRRHHLDYRTLINRPQCSAPASANVILFVHFLVVLLAVVMAKLLVWV